MHSPGAKKGFELGFVEGSTGIASRVPWVMSIAVSMIE